MLKLAATDNQPKHLSAYNMFVMNELWWKLTDDGEKRKRIIDVFVSKTFFSCSLLRNIMMIYALLCCKRSHIAV